MRTNKTEFVPVQMTPAEREALQAVANERSCSVGAVVRWAVRRSVIDDPPHQKRSGEHAVVIETGGAAPLAIQS